MYIKYIYTIYILFIVLHLSWRLTRAESFLRSCFDLKKSENSELLDLESIGSSLGIDREFIWICQYLNNGSKHEGVKIGP